MIASSIFSLVFRSSLEKLTLITPLLYIKLSILVPLGIIALNPLGILSCLSLSIIRDSKSSLAFFSISFSFVIILVAAT